MNAFEDALNTEDKRQRMLDTAAIARRYEATDVWAEGYKSGVHDARGERASAVSSAFAAGIVVGGGFVAALGWLVLR